MPEPRLAALFVGIGSPHGDDRAGWIVADALADLGGDEIAIRKASVPADLFDELHGTAKLVVCDAVRGAGAPGSMHRWRWPDPRIAQARPSGSHDLGLSEVLQIAANLGQLPDEVIVWGIEAGETECGPDVELSPEVQRCCRELVQHLRGELREAILAGRKGSQSR